VNIYIIEVIWLWKEYWY